MKIRSILSAIGLAAFAVSAQAGPPMGPIDPVPAPADDLGMTIAVGYDSSYIFRGVNYGDHLITGEVNYGTSLTDQLGLDLGVWYGSLADVDYDELNLLAALSYDAGFATLSVGYTWYYFPRAGAGVSDSTGEVVAGISRDFGFAELGLNYYYDHDVFEGHYIEAVASKTFAITDRLSLVPSVSIAYEVDYNTTTDGFSNVGLSLALPYALSDRAVLAPYIAGNLPIDILEDAGVDDEVYGGVSLQVSF